MPWLLLLVWLTFPALGQSLEWAVKATYLYKLASFVDWPESAFDSPTSAIAICVVGDDPFGGTLDQAVAGQTVGGRPIAVRRLDAIGPQSGCHVAYSAQGGLSAVRGSPVLTVTDRSSNGGIVNFVLSENRVRFEINSQAAAQNGLTISSKVLNLARPRS